MRIALSIPMSLGEIASAVGGRANADGNVTHLVTDSREVRQCDLFIALEGRDRSGESFIKDAEERGGYSLGRKVGRGIAVEDGGTALLRLASYYKGKLPLLKKAVAITGSVGKTTTKEFLRVFSGEQYRTHANEGNLNNLIGVPLTALSAPRDTEIMILEMGMNSRGEISKLSRCALPDVGVITNVGTAHIGMLGSREAIAEAKMEIRDGLNGPLAVPYGEKLLSGDLTFSTVHPDADVFVSSSNGRITCHRKDHAPFEPDFSLKGTHMLDCLSAAICAATLIGVDDSNIKTGISSLSSVILRQRYIKLQNMTLFADYYNACCESVIAGLALLNAEKGYKHKGALIGDILEAGDMSKDIHATVGVAAASYGLSHLYLFGRDVMYTRDAAIAAGFPKERILYNERLDCPEITARDIIANAEEGELILCKASRGTRLERIVEYLLKSEGKLN